MLNKKHAEYNLLPLFLNYEKAGVKSNLYANSCLSKYFKSIRFFFLQGKRGGGHILTL